VNPHEGDGSYSSTESVSIADTSPGLGGVSTVDLPFVVLEHEQEECSVGS